jgi:hypothetical protein
MRVRGLIKEIAELIITKVIVFKTVFLVNPTPEGPNRSAEDNNVLIRRICSDQTRDLSTSHLFEPLHKFSHILG